MDLSKIKLFEGLPEAALRALAEKTSGRSMPAGAPIVQEGEAADSLHVILRGSVRIYLRDENGAEVTLATKHVGEYFGEMMLGSPTRSASVAALEPCELGVIAREDFTAFLRAHPEAPLRLIGDLASIGRDMNTRARDERSTRDILRRYVNELEGRKILHAPSVRRWEYAKRVVLGLLLVFAVLQFYFSDVMLQMMALGRTTVFIGH
jgi:CRP-like cAMP-binding protein